MISFFKKFLQKRTFVKFLRYSKYLKNTTFNRPKSRKFLTDVRELNFENWITVSTDSFLPTVCPSRSGNYSPYSHSFLFSFFLVFFCALYRPHFWSYNLENWNQYSSRPNLKTVFWIFWKSHFWGFGGLFWGQKSENSSFFS